MKVRETPKNRKRIFGAGIMFLMVVLALATAVMAANGRDADGSYSLKIQKKFAEGIDSAVLAAAQGKTYTFKVEGTKREGYDAEGNTITVPVNETVTLPHNGSWEYTIPFGTPFNVSVTEITNNITLKVDGKEYNMGDSRAETVTLFNESPQVRELHNNGKLVLSRPATKLVPVGNSFEEAAVTTTSTFKITRKWTADPNVQPPGWETSVPEGTCISKEAPEGKSIKWSNPLWTTVTLAPGSKYEFTDLPAGEYTVEDMSVSGYNIQLGERTQTVEAKEIDGKPGEFEAVGTFYINSKPGKLKITAGGTAGDRHYYTVKRVEAPSGAQDFTDRVTEAVLSGETYTLDNLPRGKYEVKEYTFSGAPTQFKVKVPETESEKVSYQYAKRFFGTDKASFTSFPAGGDYITDLKFGPLRNSSNNAIANRFTYKFAYRYKSAETEPGKYEQTGTFTVPANKGYVDSNRAVIYPRDSGTLAFAVWNITATTGDHVDLSWVEHTRKDPTTYNAKYSNTDYSVTIDDRGWMEIKAPEQGSGTGAEAVTYTYTITDNNGNSQTVTLNPDETKKIEGLAAGSYLVRETVNLDQPDGFEMEISGDPFGSDEAGKEFELTVMGNRDLTITKYGDPTADGGRDYHFTVEKIRGDSSFEPQTVTLKAGGSSTPIPLPAGKYKVTPTDDMTEVFELMSSDSSQVKAEVPSGQAASITFTNVFTEGTLGYRYVHEYYIGHPDADGNCTSYTYEGCSPVTTVGGRSESDEFYNSVDIAKERTFTIGGQTYDYDYMPANNGYGYVDKTLQSDSGTNGLRTANASTEKDTKGSIYYHVDNGLTAARKIGVDAEKSQIIILRYYRVLPEEQRGTYNYIHVYYLRDKDGDHWEGSSEMVTGVHGQLNMPYRAGDGQAVTPVPEFTAQCDEHKGQKFTYTYNQRPSYGTLSKDHTDPLVELYRIVDSSETTHWHYKPNSDADHIVATKEGDQIIILRYYREANPTVTTGTYKVVHEYYFQETLEDQGSEEEDSENKGEENPETGTDVSGETDPAQQPGDNDPAQQPGDNDPAQGPGDNDPAQQPEDNDPVQHPGDNDPVQHPGDNDPVQQPEDNDPAQQPENNDPAPEPGDDKPEESGLVQEPGTDDPGEDDPAQEPGTDDPGEDDPAQEPETNEPGENNLLPRESTEVDSPTEGTTSFSGTLSSDNEGHTYIFEGARKVETISAPLGSVHKGGDVAQLKDWKPDGANEYSYDYYDAVYGKADSLDHYSYDANMEWAASTEDGSEIIILRYYRNEDTPIKPPDKPENPDNPNPPGGGGGGGGGNDPDPTPPPEDPKDPPTNPENPPVDPENPPVDPENPPVDPENPPVDPENPPVDPENPPTDPEHPTELPDPNDPDSPDEITIWENGVPKTYVKVWDPENEAWIYIPEEDVPLWNKVPKTGDGSRTELWAALAAASLCGAAALNLRKKKSN